ncbi:hypothetical protein ACVCAH_36410, partial [Micromonospora sp. LZ34]
MGLDELGEPPGEEILTDDVVMERQAAGRAGPHKVLALVRRTRPSTMISFDPNCRPSVTSDPIGARERINAFVRLSDVVKVSGDDLDWIYPGRPYQEAGRRWLALGAHVV